MKNNRLLLVCEYEPCALWIADLQTRSQDPRVLREFLKRSDPDGGGHADREVRTSRMSFNADCESSAGRPRSNGTLAIHPVAAQRRQSSHRTFAPQHDAGCDFVASLLQFVRLMPLAFTSSKTFAQRSRFSATSSGEQLR
jgi:hypothetical protein